MKRHTSKRRTQKATRRQRRSARPEFQLTVPVTWEGVAGSAARTAKEMRQRAHTISWRTKLAALPKTLRIGPRWASFFLLLVVGASLYFVGVKQVYFVSQVNVAGAVTLSPQAVAEASGAGGMHSFWVNPAEAAERLTDLPNVLTATVEIAWPNQVDITISERAPIMVWDQTGDRFWLDERGRLMQARQQSKNLLVVYSQDAETLFVNDRIPTQVLEGALHLRRLRPNIGELYYSRENGLSYQDGRNWRVYFGVGTDMNQKLIVYEALVERLMARDLQPEYISVINKEKPYYKLAEPAG